MGLPMIWILCGFYEWNNPAQSRIEFEKPWCQWRTHHIISFFHHTIPFKVIKLIVQGLSSKMHSCVKLTDTAPKFSSSSSATLLMWQGCATRFAKALLGSFTFLKWTQTAIVWSSSKTTPFLHRMRGSDNGWLPINPLCHIHKCARISTRLHVRNPLQPCSPFRCHEGSLILAAHNRLISCNRVNTAPAKVL